MQPEQIPEGTVQLPPQLSTIAPEVDDMYYFIYWVSVVFFVAIVAAMFYFMWKYRRRPGHKAKPTGHATALEITWTFAPLILLVVLFHEGFVGYVRGSVAPDEAYEVRVRGMQWNWEFEHRGGVIDALNVLKVPVGEPVQLIMSSSDVLHSFFVPVFRTKRDVVPGMWTSIWFEATHETGEVPCDSDADCAAAGMNHGFHCSGKPGDPARSEEEPEGRVCVATVFCTEYCGASPGITQSAFDDPDGPGRNTNHSTMIADLHIISVEAYETFLEEGPPAPAACQALGEGDEMMSCWGEHLYNTSGCTACHAVDGVRQQPAPNWAGLWGRSRSFADGSSGAADEEYIKNSIMSPQSQIVEGYTNVNMPPYRFSDRQLDAIVAYIQSLSPEGGE